MCGRDRVLANLLGSESGPGGRGRSELNPAQRFLAYSAAFEETYVDDDWSRLEEFFTEEAVYAVSLGPPLGGRWTGRRAGLDHLRESVDQLDRRFDERKIEVVGTPSVGEDYVSFDWRGTYKMAGCADLVFGGSERATFDVGSDPGRIRLLEDEMEEGSDPVIREWLEKFVG